jgi:gas vesicle protein
VSNRVYYSEEAEKEMERQKMISTVVNIVVGLALGLTFGGIVALLFAPNKGQKTRKKIANQIDDTAGMSRDMTNDAIKMLEKRYDALKEQMDKMVDKVRS